MQGQRYGVKREQARHAKAAARQVADRSPKPFLASNWAFLFAEVVHRRLKIASLKVEKERFLPQRRTFFTPKRVRFLKTNYAKSFIYNKSLSSFPLF
jgi:hypothetical protein